MQLPSSGMCVFDETCGYGLALEHNGDLYSCDHFVEPDYLLGNLYKVHMRELVSSDEQYIFGVNKRDALPKFCLECPVLFACKGECPKNRFILTPDGEPGLNYLCSGYKAFFQHADESMKVMAMLMFNDRFASEVTQILAKRKEELSQLYQSSKPEHPCPCGSGLKLQACHGWKPPSRGYRKRSGQAGGPRPPTLSIVKNQK
jgi:uncharacterized protein